MKYVKKFGNFKNKKATIKRLSEEEYQKEVEKHDGKQPDDGLRVEEIKTDDTATTITP